MNKYFCRISNQYKYRGTCGNSGRTPYDMIIVSGALCFQCKFLNCHKTCI